MSDSDLGSEHRDTEGSEHRAGATKGLNELRSLLVGPERTLLLSLQARLDDRHAQARDVSRVLPDAIALCSTDPQLTTALRPSVEEAITASVRRNPQPLADALFPVIGPAIRKAIAHTLGAMLESLNRTVEHSLSWRAMRWRLDALTTGKSFAEVVLLHTLVYRVEQIFLIHRESGLLLQHVAADAIIAQDASMVSAMLTAIRDFVHDSFGAAREDALDALKVGELSILIEQGPRAVLAAVVRGTPPQDVRVTLQHAVETIHLHHETDLESFEGDAAPFEAARPILQACLQAQYREPERKRSYGGLVLAAVVLVAAAVWGLSAVNERQRWNEYLDRLQEEPGIVVVAAGRRGGKYFVTGLRDPLARDPADILQRAGYTPADVAGNWEQYQTLEPGFTLARAQAMLRPPPGVRLTLHDGIISAEGVAPVGWIRESERLAPLVPGVKRFDDAPARKTEFAKLATEIAASTIRFSKGEATIATGDGDLRAVIARVRRLDELASIARQRAGLEVVGHTDSDGLPAENLPLSQARARTVVGALSAERLGSVDITSRGVGSTAPLTPGGTELEKQQNRRVSFRVSWADGRDVKAPQR